MVRALFAVARVHQPSVVFIDEIDSLLTSRSEGEHESSRKMKTEFLVQLDGATTVGEERILVVGATNRPQELDDAARRRLVKRLYIPLPDQPARLRILSSLLSKVECIVTRAEMEDISHRTEGYSGADMANLCKEAAFGAVRIFSMEQIMQMKKEDVRSDGRTRLFFDTKVLLQGNRALRPASCPQTGQGFRQRAGPGRLPGLGQEVRGQQVRL